MVLDRHVVQGVEEHRDVEAGVGQRQILGLALEVVLSAGRLGGAGPAELTLGGFDARRPRAQARHQAHQRSIAAADVGDAGVVQFEHLLDHLAVRAMWQVVHGREYAGAPALRARTGTRAISRRRKML